MLLQCFNKSDFRKLTLAVGDDDIAHLLTAKNLIYIVI